MSRRRRCARRRRSSSRLDGSAPFTTITAALAASRPGDIVRVEPGVYRERVELRRRRRPGRPRARHRHDRAPRGRRDPGAVGDRRAQRARRRDQDRVGDTDRRRRPCRRAGGDPGSRRDHRADSPRDRARPGLDGHRPRQPDRDRPERLLALPDDGHATIRELHPRRAAADPARAGAVGGAGRRISCCAGNVFSGFGADIVDGVAPAQRAELLAGNVVVPIERPAAAPAGAARPRAARGGR